MQSSCVYADSVPYTRHMPSSPLESWIRVALHCALMAASADGWQMTYTPYGGTKASAANVFQVSC